MDRRTVLVGAASLPAWLSLGFAAGAKSTSRSERLPARIEHARNIGKPLLVLLVPADEAETMKRGQMWGHYFAHLSDEQALDLSLCAVSCSSIAEVAAVLKGGRLEGVDDETWAVLLETESERVRPVLVRGDVPFTQVTRNRGIAPEMQPALAKLLHAAIVPDEAARKRRLDQCGTIDMMRKMMGIQDADSDGARFEGLGAGGPQRRCDLDRFAAYVRFGAEHPMGEVGGKTQLELLADAVRIRLFENDPDGARWMARMAYCPPCGMGYVPPEARLFLEFFAG